MAAQTDAFFFGPGEGLLGFHSAPAQGPGRGSLLICPSLFADTTRSQWLVRNLAGRLVEDGFHVFRFDFSGMAGSAGGMAERRVDQWTDDLRAAVTEAEGRAARPVSAVFSVRAGTLLWANAGGLPSVERFIAWDPPSSGSAFLTAMRQLQGIYEERTPSPDPAYALGGLTVDETVADELEAMGPPVVDADQCYHLCSADVPAAQLPGPWQRIQVDGSYDWTAWILHVFHAQDVILRAMEVLT